MSLEQKYYDYLTRTDHPAYRKVQADVSSFDADTPFNSLFNLILAKQLARLRSDLELLRLISHPDTVPESALADWEIAYFGYVNGGKAVEQRIEELVARYNLVANMSLPFTVALAEHLTGQTPTILRSVFFDGWVLDTDRSVLDVSTILAGEVQGEDAHSYYLIFDHPVSSEVLKVLDERLKMIERGGSVHTIIVQGVVWVP